MRLFRVKLGWFLTFLIFTFRPTDLLVGSLHAEQFERHAVVSQESHASDVGLQILQDGGNAIDAAIATGFALAVTHPAAGNIGGGGFIVAFLADRDEVVTVDFRERAPEAATISMYLDQQGELLPGHRGGPRAAGVPGTVRGLGLAHHEYGSLPWKQLVAPAVELAAVGFPVSESLARSLNAQLFDRQNQPRPLDGSGEGSRLSNFKASVRAFRKPEGSPWKAGDLLRQPDLAATLNRIAEEGPDEFYEGKTAELIVEAMKNGGGIISRNDLKTYQAILRPPVQRPYKGTEVFGMGPPSSGGVVDLLMLGILERFELHQDGPDHPRTLHRITEAMRRAFYVRATELADPDFVAIPLGELLGDPFIDELAGSIEETATPSEDLADFPIDGIAEGIQTTHLSTIDSEGNAVALTYTLEQGYGSKAVVAGAGFLLNNEMGDFNIVLGRTDQRGTIGTKPNRIEPGKRMLSSMSPVIVLENRKVRVVTGSPGGRTIPNTVLWVLLNVLEFERSPRVVVDAPRTHHAWFPDLLLLEGNDWEPSTLEALRDRGHRVRQGTLQGDAHTIIVDPTTGVIHGVADQRRATSKASGD